MNGIREPGPGTVPTKDDATFDVASSLDALTLVERLGVWLKDLQLFDCHDLGRNDDIPAVVALCALEAAAACGCDAA